MIPPGPPVGLMLLLALAGDSAAASFDCAKAASAIEKTLCASPRLNQLDTRMGLAYARALRACPTADTRHAQRDWLREQRNRCGDEACLIAAYETRLGQLARVACDNPAAPCTATPAGLLGSWKLVSEGGPHEEMAFQAGTFNSWLHQRPEIFGARWRMDRCELRIQESDGGPESRFTLLKLDANRLTLREAGEQDIATYQRVKPPGVP